MTAAPPGSLWRVDAVNAGVELLCVHGPDDEIDVPDAAVGLKETVSVRDVIGECMSAGVLSFRLTGALPMTAVRSRFSRMRSATETSWIRMAGRHHGFRPLAWLCGRPRRFIENDAGTVTVLRSVTYDGFMEITDASALLDAVSKGVGRGRGQGCGLLTVAPYDGPALDVLLNREDDR